MIKTIFFDFDGVLTTDGKGSGITCKNLHKVIPDLSYEDILGCYRSHHQELLIGKTNHIDMWKDFCTCIGKDLDISILYEAFRNTPKNNQMFRLCKDLRKKYKIGIITDNGKERFDLLVKEMQLDELFNILVLSAEVGSTKHESQIFEKALQLADCQPEECVFIDNDKNNLAVPAAMGFKTFWHDHEKNDLSLLIQQLKEWDVILN